MAAGSKTAGGRKITDANRAEMRKASRERTARMNAKRGKGAASNASAGWANKKGKKKTAGTSSTSGKSGRTAPKKRSTMQNFKASLKKGSRGSDRTR